MTMTAGAQPAYPFTLTPIKPKIGAEITGLDLTQPVDAATRQALNEAVVEHVALVVRDQKFTPAQFAAAAELFGDLMPDQIKSNLVPGLPMVSILSNFEKDSQGKQAIVPANATWHTDHTNRERPPKYTFLYAVELPDRGGGTSVVNMNAAYEALPADRRAQLDPMKTVNVRISSARFGEANPDRLKEHHDLAETPVVQPLIRTHPERGSRAIWFHTGKTERIEGMDPVETQDFLADLLAETIQPEISYTHEWRLGDLLIIDNRSSMHKARADYDMRQHRKLYRTMVEGDRPV